MVMPQMMPTAVGVSGPRPLIAMVLVGEEDSQLEVRSEVSDRVG